MECVELCTDTTFLDSAAALGAILAGAAALVSAVAAASAVRSTRRMRRSALFLMANPLLGDDGVEFTLYNRGVVPPVMAAMATFTLPPDPQGGGGSIEPPPAGGHTTFTISKNQALEGVRIEITWTDQDGSTHSMLRWYQWDGKEGTGRRSDLMTEGKLLPGVFRERPFDRKPPRRS